MLPRSVLRKITKCVVKHVGTRFQISPRFSLYTLSNKTCPRRNEKIITLIAEWLEAIITSFTSKINKFDNYVGIF